MDTLSINAATVIAKTLSPLAAQQLGDILLTRRILEQRDRLVDEQLILEDDLDSAPRSDQARRAPRQLDRPIVDRGARDDAEDPCEVLARPIVGVALRVTEAEPHHALEAEPAARRQQQGLALLRARLLRRHEAREPPAHPPVRAPGSAAQWAVDLVLWLVFAVVCC